MSDFAGRFIWYELMTSDPDAARAFYDAVAGWGTQPGPVPDMEYTLFTAGGVPRAGLMRLPDEARAVGAPPSWTGVIGVADVDHTIGRIAELGGRLVAGPMDIPTVGRYASVADPQGAHFAVFTPTMSQGEGSQGEGSQGGGADGGPGRAGSFVWHELAAADREAAFGFYQALFGWRADAAHEMGPMGTYQMFAIGENRLGGMFAKSPEMPMPFWLYYIEVEGIEAAAARVTAAGGAILNGPMQVPGGSWILQARDKQGAAFALHSATP